MGDTLVQPDATAPGRRNIYDLARDPQLSMIVREQRDEP